MIIAKEVSSKHFTYNPSKNMMVTFISDLGPLQNNIFSQIFDDACDSGFYMVSERTGEKKLFTLSEEVKDSDNDIIVWIFTHWDVNVPSEKQMKVHVLND